MSYLIGDALHAYDNDSLLQNEGLEGHISADDKELNNMFFEAAMLRREGRIQDALELEQLIRQLQLARVKRGLNKARENWGPCSARFDGHAGLSG